MNALNQSTPVTLPEGFNYIYDETNSSEIVGLSHPTFSIKTFKGPILSSAATDELTSSIRNLSKIPQASPPEATFTSSLTLKISNLTLHLTSQTYLHHWASTICPYTHPSYNTLIPPLPSYIGRTWSPSPSTLLTPLLPWDWTYTTHYSPPQISTISVTTLPVKILIERLPIIYSSHVIIYDSDLDDSGSSTLTISIRCTSTYVYVRSRNLVRIDNVLVRCFDWRVYYEIGSRIVFKETEFKCIQWEEGFEVKVWDDPVEADGILRGYDGVKNNYELHL
ncbi:hypothetical protein TrVE_jg1365 [Triparma verrucosa]|uniref:Uncharacterized protein n=1 Tax=Triparma verrucosa TaxID=1606542 RepID=A0A9W6ZBL3_9STRA|nr:hypothetical protein TrVE_jg1365 [Triparma verrucosa]